MDIKKEIRESYLGGNAIAGAKRTIKALRQNELQKIFMSSNCSETSKQEIEAIAKATETEVVKLEEKTSELGMICRKPFGISIIGIKKNE